MFDEPDGATPLDPDELAGLRHEHVTTRAQLDELEQANIVQGSQWLDAARNPDILSESFLRNLHKRLFGEVWIWAGKFRPREKSIGIDPSQISVQLHLLIENANDFQSFADLRQYRTDQ